MDTLHKHSYSIESAMCSLVPSSGPVLCRDEMEEWSASEANLFEEALDKYGKDFNDIRQDFVSSTYRMSERTTTLLICHPTPVHNEFVTFTCSCHGNHSKTLSNTITCGKRPIAMFSRNELRPLTLNLS